MMRVGSKVTWRDSASAEKLGVSNLIPDNKAPPVMRIARKSKEENQRTSRPARAHSPVPGVRGIATDIPHLRIQQAFVLEVLAEEVLDAPEAAGGDGALLGVVGDLGGGFGGEGEAGGGGEGAEEALQEGGHLGGHDGEGDEENEAGG